MTGFMDFRYWLISMGHDVYFNAMADVETLADVAFLPGIEVTRFEEFGSIAANVLRKKYPEYEDDLPAIEHPTEPVGEDWDDDELPQRFPRLWAAKVAFENN